MMKKLFTGLFVSVVIALSSCAGDSNENETLDLKPDYYGNEQESDLCETEKSSELGELTNLENWPELIEQNESLGLTSANVRLRHVDDGVLWHNNPEHSFDLSQVEYYHEFVNKSGGVRVVFTTESTVQNFRFFSVEWNNRFFRDYATDYDRMYKVEQVLYTLDALTPNVPFVVTGVGWGGAAIAANGFSFIDENGITRYFVFLENASDDSSEAISVIEF